MFYEIFKFLVGFFLAIFLLAGASVAAALYFAATLTATPEKPTFPNDRPASQTVSNKGKSSTASIPSLTSSPSPTPEEKLEPGTYRAIVTQPIGLILRDSPNRDGNRIGGIAYKDKVVVLEDSADKQWQRVRSQDGERREGWVKGGNTERVEGE